MIDVCVEDYGDNSTLIIELSLLDGCWQRGVVRHSGVPVGASASVNHLIPCLVVTRM
jgi:hypothetical protein